ncbi:MAG: glycosyltransferase [Patescibacteria group bacterium]
MENLPKQANLLLITGQDWGGAQSYVFDLAKEMKKRSMSVIVAAGAPKRGARSSEHEAQSTKRGVASGDINNNHVNQNNHANHGSDLGTRCKEAGIAFYELKHMARDINPTANLRATWELIKLFRALRPRAVHLNSSMMGATGSLAATLCGVPKRIYCIGGWVFNEDLPKWKKTFYIWIEKVSAKWKDVITVVHPGDEDLAKRLRIRPQKRLLTIPNGIDAVEFEKRLLTREKAREILEINPQAKIIGTIANAYPPKNLFWYLDVCKMVHETDRRIFFVIIGEGPQFDELKRKRDALGAQNFIMLTGMRKDAPTLYRAFDMFALPSSKEGMSITLLESMAAKVPIIATDVGANRWMLGKNGGVIVPINKKILAEEILELISNPDKQKSLSANAYNRLCENFTWDKTAESTLALFTAF